MSNEVFKLRIVADTEEDIFADVLVDTSYHFLSLHRYILDLFKLDKLEMASFYLSNDEWDKGEEITLFDMSSEEDEFSPLSMESTSIFQIYEKTNKILYVHDFLNMNIFYVEILDLLPGNQHHAQIQLIHHFGTYVPKKMETHEADTNMDQINEIYDEFKEDPLNGDFEELDEDLY